MNRTQRKYGRVPPKKDAPQYIKINKLEVSKKHELKEILSPRCKRNPFKHDKAVSNRSYSENVKAVINRCCSPRSRHADVEKTAIENHIHTLIKQQYDYDTVFPDTIKNLKELRNMFCETMDNKVEKSSQYISLGSPAKLPSYVQTSDGFQWQNVDDMGDLEKILNAEKQGVYSTKDLNSKNIYIGEIPLIKVIAEKFSKVTRNNVEVRKLDEKVVCVEYDVFDDDCMTDSTPVQKMRAFFSVKPKSTSDNEDTVKFLPFTIKNKLYITEADLGKLNEKEIEIIDEKIEANKPYLEDLKRVLKRKRAIYAKKQRSSLDLKSLYEMAKREVPTLDEDFSNTNLLSKAELEEIKDLITKQCVSVHGINRRTLKCELDEEPQRDVNSNFISESIFAELTRNDVH